MKKLILPLIIAVLLTSCAVSSLKVEKNSELILEQNSNSYQLGLSTHNKLLRFVNLNITQNSIKRSASNTLFFEEIIVDQAYEFSRGSVETLKIIFDVTESNIIYKSATLLLVQFRVQNNKYINIMAETSAIQNMSYVYGYTNEEFVTLAKELSITINSKKLQESVGVKKPVTKWSQTRLILEPLLQPFDKFGRL